MLNNNDIPMTSLESQVASPQFFNLLISHEETNDFNDINDTSPHSLMSSFLFFNCEKGYSSVYLLSSRQYAFCFHSQIQWLSLGFDL